MKLMNNLSIETMLESIESSYDQNFSKGQINELIDGYNDGVDIRAYADPHIPEHFMFPICQVLKEFGNPNDCKVFKRKIINYLYNGHNISQITELAKGMLSNINESLYADKSFSSLTMYTIRTNLERGIDIRSYVRQRFTTSQIDEIADGLFLNLDVSCYANKEFTPQQMRLIRTGLEEGLDARQYADPSLSYTEMIFKLDDLRHPIIIGGS